MSKVPPSFVVSCAKVFLKRCKAGWPPHGAQWVPSAVAVIGSGARRQQPSLASQSLALLGTRQKCSGKQQQAKLGAVSRLGGAVREGYKEQLTSRSMGESIALVMQNFSTTGRSIPPSFSVFEPLS